MECRVSWLRRNTFIGYAVTGSISINRGLIQAIPTSLPPQPIGEATKASNLRRIPPGVQGRSHFTYFLYLIVQNTNPVRIMRTMSGIDVDTLTMEQYLALSRENHAPGVAVMLRVFPFTLTGAAKRWVDRLAPGTINTWDLLKKAFIQRYCPPSMTTNQLEDIYNFKQEGDESLYQAWERYNNLLYKCPTHDINCHQKGPIPGMRPAEALTAIQTMADHSKKWHDGTTSRNIRSSSSNDGLDALVNKLDNLGRDIKKLKESVHAIQIGCQICEGPLLDKDCPLNEEVKQVEEIDNHPPYGEKRQSLEGLLAKHQEESARRSTEMEVWIKKLQENAEINTKNQSASLKNLETQIEQLTKGIRSDKTLDSSSEQIKTITADQETSGLNKLHGVSLISDPESDATKVLQHQLPRKELNPGNFALPCTIGKFNFYAMANLGASINVMPRSIFEHLHLTNLRKTNMLYEMADTSKKASLGIVENILVKTGKFLFLSDFVIIDNTPPKTTILGRPFLATIRAEIDVFAGKISLGINKDRISFDSMRNSHKYTNPSERIFMVRPQSPAQSNNQIDYKESARLEVLLLLKLDDTYVVGFEFFNCLSISFIGKDIQKKDEKQSKIDKMKHGMESVKKTKQNQAKKSTEKSI
ncbi:reverse transcriptase domain-containing protein [Tanacetum coccineum]|uniref:Reverse transcriptase domain-containing protein n=1 Tax=Tanacetum coccineum TaxID=301880 RepID=A0ABQ5H2X6_9ASTR